MVWTIGALTLSLEYHKVTWLLYAWFIILSPSLVASEVSNGAVEDATGDLPRSTGALGS